MGGLSKKRLSSWKIALILVLLSFLAATLLRFDHIEMTKLRDAVMSADAENNDDKIESSLKELHSFVLKHIIFNTVQENGIEKITFGTGPFYLENQYLRKANEAIAKAKEDIDKNSTNPNGNIYKQVADICDAKSRANGWGFNALYIQCFQDELSKYPVEETMDAYGAAILPSTELFRYEYSSPLWYPCWSGFVILLCVILALILIIRFIIWVILRIGLFFFNRTRKK